MQEMTPAPQKVDRKTLWIVLGIALVVLCCFVIAAGIGVYLLFGRDGKLALPQFGNTPTPTRALPVPTKTPVRLEGPLTIEAYNPENTNYSTLQDLTPDWSASTVPGLQAWKTTVSSDEPAMLFMGWCTTTQAILEQNFQHIHYSVNVDGRDINVSTLYLWNSTDSQQVCRTYVGLIRQWTGSEHTLTITMEFTTSINDGWSDYQAGKYIDVYHITVIP